ncbi:MAG: serine hydrolase domain-containing protein [Myxococcota bacterium]
MEPWDGRAMNATRGNRGRGRPLRGWARAGRWAFVACLFGFLACASPGPPERPAGREARGDFAYLEKRLDYAGERALSELEGVSLALFDRDRVLFAAGYGEADAANGRPATADTLYRVGSISKLFTAIAVLQLVEAGQLELDAPLTRYLPAFRLGPPPPFLPGSAAWSLDDITLRSMLTHHSGIPSDILKGFFSDDPPRQADYVELIGTYHAQAPVGFVMAYSNIAYTLLGQVVEVVSGVPFPEYVRTQILAPAAMDASSFEPTPEILDRVARSYRGEDEVPARRIGQLGAGGLFSSVQDLARFGQMALRGGEGERGRVLEKTTLASMWVQQNAEVALDGEVEIGLTWWRNPPGRKIRNGGLAVGHSGAMVAHRAHLLLLPERNLGAVAVTNTAEGGFRAHRLMQLALRLGMEAKYGIAPDAPEPPDVATPRTDAPSLDALAGRWATSAAALALRRQGGALRSQNLAWASALELVPAAEGTFEPRIRVFGLFPYATDFLARNRLRFERVGDLDAVFLEAKNSPSTLFGWRANPSPATEAWRARVGGYRLTNGEGDFRFFERAELSIQGDRLVVSLFAVGEPMPLSQYFEPLSDTEAVSWSLGRSGGARIRVTRDRQGEVIEALGYRLRRE